MSKEMRAQGGFIQIPLLAGIVLFLIVSVGMNAVLHKQETKQSITDGAASVFNGITKQEEQKTEQSSNQEQTTISSETVSQQDSEKVKLQEDVSKANAEAKRARAEAERLKKEAEQAKIKADSERQQAQTDANVNAQQELENQLRVQALIDQRKKDALIEEQKLEQQRQEQARIAQEQESLRQQVLAQQVQADQDKTNRINALMSEYQKKNNDFNAQILAIKQQYYIDVENVKRQAVSMSFINGQIQKLTDDANWKIQGIQIQQESLRLEYLNKINSIQ